MWWPCVEVERMKRGVVAREIVWWRKAQRLGGAVTDVLWWCVDKTEKEKERRGKREPGRVSVL